MVFHAIPDFPQIPICSLASPAAAGPFAVLDRDRSNEAILLRLAQTYGPDLVVPEVWRNILPQAGILISSSISGGTLKDRFQEAAAMNPRRCWLLLEPLSAEFLLPCPDGQSKQVTITDYGNSFYSETLCCMYSHTVRNGTGVMTLWDTAETWIEKQKLAKAAGFLGVAVLPSGLDD